MLDVGVGKHQALLALLLVNAGEVVSVQRLIDGLWGDVPPKTAAKTLQGYVSHLRKALGSAAILTRAGGYLIAVTDGELDAARFEQLADAAGACLHDDPRRASELLRAALALWRGDALEGLDLHAHAQTEARRLAERRLVAREQHIEARLALGRHAELVGELQHLVAVEPYRETLRDI